MIGRQTRRLATVATTAALLALAVMAGPGLAANTREVYIGDPGGAYDASLDPQPNGTLTYTQTRPGGLTAVDIEVRNEGGQTLNRADLLGGYAAETGPSNPLFPSPTYDSLPAGLTYAAAYVIEGTGSCTRGPDGDGVADRSLVCDLGTFAAGTSKTVRVVISTPADPDGDPLTPNDASFPTWYGVYLNEGNETGSNQDNFYAEGTVRTTTPVCSADQNANRDANYFLPASTVSLSSSSCGAIAQEGRLASRSALGDKGAYGELSIGGPIADGPAGYTFYGSAVYADVLDGEPVPGGLQWTIKWYGTRSLGGVIHLWDSYVQGDLADAIDPDAHGDDYTVIPFTKRYQCSAKLTTDCWVSTSASKGNVTPSWFEAVFVTPDNGRGGGFQ